MKDVAIACIACITGSMVGLVPALLAPVPEKPDSLSLDELRHSGYEVIRHSETHGDFSTNWVEIVRTDGRPL